MTTIPILCYHAVSEDTGGPLAPWAMSPDRFDEHLDALAGAGYVPLALDDLVATVHDRGEPPPESSVVLTVDDGYADVAETIWPRLARRGWPATLYVSTGLIGRRFHGRPMLSRPALADLAAAGLTIGAHGHRHRPLDELDRATARDEIHRSRDDLTDWLGHPVATFAYPHGFHDRGTRQLVVEAGFTSACAVKQALSTPDDDRFALARIMPTGATTGADLVRDLADPRAPHARGGRERLRTTAHRYVRRTRARRTAVATDRRVVTS